MPKLLKKRKKGGQAVSYALPYKGSMGKSMDKETAKKKWDSKASSDELLLGSKITQDSDGNFIARTRLSSKA